MEDIGPIVGEPLKGEEMGLNDVLNLGTEAADLLAIQAAGGTLTEAQSDQLEGTTALLRGIRQLRENQNQSAI